MGRIWRSLFLVCAATCVGLGLFTVLAEARASAVSLSGLRFQQRFDITRTPVHGWLIPPRGCTWRIGEFRETVRQLSPRVSGWRVASGRNVFVTEATPSLKPSFFSAGVTLTSARGRKALHAYVGPNPGPCINPSPLAPNKPLVADVSTGAEPNVAQYCGAASYSSSGGSITLTITVRRTTDNWNTCLATHTAR